jgi:tRNA 2-thiouridine synthesizing protein E
MVETRIPGGIELDEDSLLKDPRQWNETVAEAIARVNDIPQLTDIHWKVIYNLRNHYHRFGSAPAMSHICHMHDLGRFCGHDLFHSCLNAWRVAGLPNPGEEVKAYMSGI